jgi:hypothetical protein
MLYLNQDMIEATYPMVHKWREVREHLDPKGTFLNDFIIKMGLA